MMCGQTLVYRRHLRSSSIVSIIDLTGQNINLFSSQKVIYIVDRYIIRVATKWKSVWSVTKPGGVCAFKGKDDQWNEGHRGEEMTYLLCVTSQLCTRRPDRDGSKSC